MKKKLLIVFCSLFLIFCLCFCVVRSKNVLYDTTYQFEFGSRRVKIYNNGDVYDDLEVEEPEHKVKFQFLKKLSSNELDSLKNELSKDLNRDQLDLFVIKLVYGVEEFNSDGGY